MLLTLIRAVEAAESGIEAWAKQVLGGLDDNERQVDEFVKVHTTKLSDIAAQVLADARSREEALQQVCACACRWWGGYQCVCLLLLLLLLLLQLLLGQDHAAPDDFSMTAQEAANTNTSTASAKCQCQYQPQYQY